MNTNKISKGIYCYDENGKCPYFTSLQIYDKLSYTDENESPLPPIEIPYCLYTKKGSLPNGDWKNNEFKRLQDHFGYTEDEVYDNLLQDDLLWDQVKSCGKNKYIGL